jgi:3'(2'), 5'-bisphosphate nucleotidase
LSGFTATHAELTAALVEICRGAGRLVMEVYNADFAAQAKADASPVTEADLRAEAFIVKELQKLLPAVPVVAEESAAAGHLPEIGRCFWLVDPLDGTKEFVAKNGEFTVNIALIEDGVPILGVVQAPALDQIFAGGPAIGSWRESNGRRTPLTARRAPAEGLTVACSRSHGDMDAIRVFLGTRPIAKLAPAGSSLKFCLVAAGEADLYPRLGRTMEWDTAAGHAVLSGAGGGVVDLLGQPLRYGKPGFENPHFVACGIQD